MCSVAIKNRAISIGNLARVVKNDDLSSEVRDSSSWLVLGIGGNISSLDILDRYVLDVETNIVSRDSFWERLVVHFNGFDLSGQLVRGKGDNHTGFDDSSFNTTNWDCSNASNFVNILKGQSEGLVCWSLWWNNGIEGFQEGSSAGLSFLTLNIPSLVPGHVGAGLQHVVSMPSRNGDEWNSNRVVSDLLDETRDLLLDFFKSCLAVWRLSGVHLVNSNNELLDSKCVSQKSVLSGLSVLRNTSLKLAGS